MTRMKWIFLGGMLVVQPLLADDGVLPDPTRPPESLSIQAVNGISPVSGPILQSVILRRQGVPVAVISGQTVPLGGKVGESVLTQIRENAVVLKGPLGSEVLRMTPDVSKKNIAEHPRPSGRRK